MAKSARASTNKAKRSRLRAAVFGPVESARTQRLSERLQDLAAKPKPERPEMEVDKANGQLKSQPTSPSKFDALADPEKAASNDPTDSHDEPASGNTEGGSQASAGTPHSTASRASEAMAPKTKSEINKELSGRFIFMLGLSRDVAFAEGGEGLGFKFDVLKDALPSTFRVNPEHFGDAY
ncbi:hypothetical protein NA57DRAFT_80972 [Rhizodiscina lignyota]|uniref:DUF2423 domain-containing protein n=1 Tax=Rhizodiscina lignyota TaxID=1504668 RepID=A0A9P4I6B1_9PEZI|nr:hypothetical protein NA57DRAFT_80972 [Rhizodiscina lignyota]